MQTKLKYLNYCATPGDEFCHHMVEIDAQNTATKWLIAIKINAKVGITINLFVRRVKISDVGTNLNPIMTFQKNSRNFSKRYAINVLNKICQIWNLTSSVDLVLS